MTDIAGPILEVRNFCKNFTGTKALNNVSCSFYPGEIHALLGENGAGKSTLIKILAGVYEADSGSVVFDGKDVGLDARQLPLAVIHQDLGLADEMSVADNIALVSGYEKNSGVISWRKTRKKAADLLAKMNCQVDPAEQVELLSAAEKSMVAISRALSLDAKILILDEPTATLPNRDVEKLFDVLKTLRAKNISIIYVTHRLDEVFAIADQITVMRNDSVVANNSVASTTPEKLVFDIVGKNPSEMFIAMPETASEKLVLEVREVIVGDIGPVSFKLKEGEILALFGLRGAGHHEIGRSIYGALPQQAGEMYLHGKKLKLRGPEQGIKRRIGFVTSKRHEEGIADSFTVRENMYINPRAALRRRAAFLSLGEERRRCRRAIDTFTIKTPGSETAIGVLSGGNQQKVVLTRLFEADCEVMILEEPTIGVDVGAKSNIYRMMREGLAEGKAIILISSGYEEVSRICHRALVFSRKTVVGEIDRNNMSDSVLTGMASGAIANAAGDC